MKRLMTWLSAGALVLPGIVVAQSAFLTVPSGLYEGDTVVVQGGNFQPEAELHLDLIREGGGHTIESIRADEDGALRFELEGMASGEYRLRAYSPSGAPLAETRVIVSE
ncbi:hypothetical protein [Alkalilimnicola ehrlichii]|uniref:hypothetical protein n=1 Tax=Alkalilimnicola ehrlichii TaxID=351052 RepID=UPI003BA180BC